MLNKSITLSTCFAEQCKLYPLRHSLQGTRDESLTHMPARKLDSYLRIFCHSVSNWPFSSHFLSSRRGLGKEMEWTGKEQGWVKL